MLHGGSEGLRGPFLNWRTQPMRVSQNDPGWVVAASQSRHSLVLPASNAVHEGIQPIVRLGRPANSQTHYWSAAELAGDRGGRVSRRTRDYGDTARAAERRGRSPWVVGVSRMYSWDAGMSAPRSAAAGVDGGGRGGEGRAGDGHTGAEGGAEGGAEALGTLHLRGPSLTSGSSETEGF